MNGSNTRQEILGGPDGKARCQCGKRRYPRYKLCPTCYYEQKQVRSESGEADSRREHQSTPKRMANRSAGGSQPDTSTRLTPDTLKTLSTAELLQLRPAPRMSLSDRHERIQFLERIYGKKFRGKAIRYMKNSQLYVISQQAGYRR